MQAIERASTRATKSSKSRGCRARPRRTASGSTPHARAWARAGAMRIRCRSALANWRTWRSSH
eukprot:3087730-Prymnesium_polylepis.1